MKQISVETAYQWMQRFAAREWHLLLPVALTFFALPGLLADVFMPNATQALLPGAVVDAGAQGRALAVVLAMLFFNTIGALAITALALVPGISVQEAIGRALRRLPALLGVLLLVTIVLLLLVLLLALGLGSARANVATIQRLLVPVIFVAGGALWVRLAAVTPVLVDRGGTPIAVLKHAWQLSRGAFWRLLGAMAIYFLGGTIVLVALSSALGAVVTLIAQALGAGGIGLVIAAVLFRLLAAVISTGFQLLIASLYRQLANRGT